MSDTIYIKSGSEIEIMRQAAKIARWAVRPSATD